MSRDKALARATFAVCFEADAEEELAKDPLAFAARFGVDDEDARALAADSRRFTVYRRLVRNQIAGSFRAMLGDVARELEERAPGLLDKCVTAFLATSAPESRHLRQVVHTLFAASKPLFTADPRVPGWLIEAIDAELVAHEVGAALDAPSTAVTELALERPILFAPHVRLRHYEFRVHEDREADATPAEGPVDLLAYRDGDLIVQWYELTPGIGAFIGTALTGATMGDAMKEWGTFNESHEDLVTTLHDLAERDVILGGGGD